MQTATTESQTPVGGLRRFADSQPVGLRLWILFWILAMLPAVAHLMAGEFPLYDDSLEYWKLGKAMAETGTYEYDGMPIAYWPPGMPWYVAQIMLNIGGTWESLTGANLFLHGMLLIMVARIGFLLGGPRIGAWTMVLWGVLWESFRQPPLILSELPYTVMLLGTVLLWFEPRFRHGPFWWFLGGLLLGLGVLVRTTTMLVIPFAVGCVLISPWHRWAEKIRTITLLAVAFIGFAIPVGLWTHRNYQHYGFVFPISLNSGENLALSNNHFGTVSYLLATDPRRYIMGINPGDPVEVHRAGKEEFRRTWKEEPVGSLFRCIPRLSTTMLRNYPWFANRLFDKNPGYHLYESLITVQWLAWLLAILLGVSLTRGPRQPLEWAILILALYWIALHSMILGDPRYRYPLVPLMLPFAAHFFLNVVPRWRGMVAWVNSTSRP